MNWLARGRATLVREGDGVPTLELFFDLVFVYAITQTVDLMAEHSNLLGLTRGLLVAVLLWWVWGSYTWLCNLVRADEGLVRYGLFAVMAVTFVIAVTIPESFVDFEGGLSGPFVFATCYAVLRVLHFGMFWSCAGDDEGLRRQLLRSIPPWFLGTALLVAAGFTEGVADGWLQVGLWALALGVDYGGTLLNGMSGWRVNSVRHFAERHGLILIVALGESIVSVGVGVHDKPISWAIIVGCVLGVAISAALWWLYFDVTATMAEHAVAAKQGPERMAMASHGYTYWHVPLVLGILLLSFGLKKVLGYVADTEHHTLTEALHGLPLYALYGGVVLYLLAHVGFAHRMLGTVKVTRLAAAGLLVLLIPVANLLPALAALGLLVLCMAGLAGYETRHYADQRAEIRSAES